MHHYKAAKKDFASGVKRATAQETILTTPETECSAKCPRCNGDTPPIVLTLECAGQKLPCDPITNRVVFQFTTTTYVDSCIAHYSNGERCTLALGSPRTMHAGDNLRVTSNTDGCYACNGTGNYLDYARNRIAGRVPRL